MLLKLITLCSALVSCGIYAFDRTVPGLWKLPVFFLAAWVCLLLLAFLFFWGICIPVSMDKPQEEDSKFYRKVLYLYEEAAMTLLKVRIHKEGFQNLPENGRFLLVCNHLHLIDPLVLHLCTPKGQLAFISKKENDRLFIVNKFMHKTLCQPIDRENDRAALQTILKCISIIKEDKASIGVFPEGYTSKDGHLQPYRNGVFKIAQRAGVPVVVCTLQNTQNAFHNALRRKRTEVTAKLLAVIPAGEVKAVKTVEIGDRIHRMMEQDLGE